jgi:hypothetical protein
MDFIAFLIFDNMISYTLNSSISCDTYDISTNSCMGHGSYSISSLPAFPLRNRKCHIVGAISHYINREISQTT